MLAGLASSTCDPSALFQYSSRLDERAAVDGLARHAHPLVIGFCIFLTRPDLTIHSCRVRQVSNPIPGIRTSTPVYLGALVLEPTSFNLPKPSTKVQDI